MRLAWYLRTRSVILRTGIFTDLLLRWLQPGVHYIPFKLTFEDLSHQLNLLNSNKDQGKKMTDAALQISNTLTGEYMLDHYMLNLLKVYSESIRFND